MPLKQKFKDSSIIKAMGCNNPLSAKIAEESGFDALWFSGFELSTAMCLPDANILTMSDSLYFLYSIIRFKQIPLIADCDSGYGDLNNVIHLVKEYERIGVNAISIEDKLFPKLNSFCNASQQLISRKDFVAKILAAKEARNSEGFLIIARTEALIDGASIEEAIDRAYAYSEAGADMIIIHSKKSDSEQIREFCMGFKANTPIGIIPTTYYKTKDQEFKDISDNIKLIIYANHGIRASIKAMQKVYQEILTTGSSEVCESNIASIEEAFKYQKIKQHQNNLKKYNKNAESLLKL